MTSRSISRTVLAPESKTYACRVWTGKEAQIDEVQSVSDVRSITSSFCFFAFAFETSKKRVMLCSRRFLELEPRVFDELEQGVFDELEPGAFNELEPGAFDDELEPRVFDELE